MAPPADKSISHRAAIIGAMASEPVRIVNYLDAADTRSTLDAVGTVGALVERHDGEVLIRGCGMRNAQPPGEPIDVGNAGTLMRLLPGWLAFQQGAAFTLDGDASIRRRPVDRIAGPLAQMGAQIEATDGRFPPFTVHGAGLQGITYELPVASAQVKSCVLLAGLATDRTTVVEADRQPRPHRADAGRAPAPTWSAARSTAAATPRASATPTSSSSRPFASPATSPAPPSSSPPACSCPARAWSWRASGSTGRGPASCASWSGWGRSSSGRSRSPAPFAAAEPVCDLDVGHGPIEATTVDADEVPLAIDELPLVALMGCFAEGETVVRGAAELRVKESDRIATVVDGLRGLGADIDALEDGFAVRGRGTLRGGRIDAHGDHRLALLGAVAGLASQEGVEVVGMEAAEVSYPGFAQDIAALAG